MKQCLYHFRVVGLEEKERPIIERAIALTEWSGLKSTIDSRMAHEARHSVDGCHERTLPALVEPCRNHFRRHWEAVALGWKHPSPDA
jgi:hypothetical protein